MRLALWVARHGVDPEYMSPVPRNYALRSTVAIGGEPDFKSSPVLCLAVGATRGVALTTRATGGTSSARSCHGGRSSPLRWWHTDAGHVFGARRGRVLPERGDIRCGYTRL